LGCPETNTPILLPAHFIGRETQRLGLINGHDAPSPELPVVICRAAVITNAVRAQSPDPGNHEESL
jgi:hypothetical protein